MFHKYAYGNSWAEVYWRSICSFVYVFEFECVMVLTSTLIRVKCISIKVVACIFSIDVYLQTQSHSNLIKVFIVKRLWNTQLLKSTTFKAKHPPPLQLTSPRNVANASRSPNHMNPLLWKGNCKLQDIHMIKAWE